jgi:arabinofuranosyltransferase
VLRDVGQLHTGDASIISSEAAPRRSTYALLWAGLIGCVFAWNVYQHAFIGDDAYISFRYADNLVRGEGLVWNAGERVEGYTNFLWVLLSALWLWLSIPPELGANALGALSGAGVLVTLALLARHQLGRFDFFAGAMLLTLAASRTFTAWCTGGLETMFFGFLVLLGFVRLIHERKVHADGDAAPLSAFVFGLAALTRPEGVLFAAVAGGALALDRLQGRRTTPALLGWAAPLVAIVGSHLAFRWLYYGELLPNTFYAKVSGAWFAQGITYLGLYAREYRVLPFVPLALLAAWRPTGSASRLFLCVVGVHLAYILYIGGDRFEFRFLIVILPFVYWLLFDGARKLAALGTEGEASRRAARAVAIAAALGIVATTVQGSREESQRFQRHGMAGLAGIENYARSRAHQGRFLRSMIDAGELPASLTIAVGGAGALPYYTRWTTVDRHGLSDAYIARLPADRARAVAHQHDAPFDYLEEREVVVFDVFNRLVHFGTGRLQHRLKRFHQGRPLPLRAVAVGNRYMVFGTFVSDAELAAIFPGRTILGPDGPIRSASPDAAGAEDLGTEP